MRDYIAEANRFMYDDSYIVESESSVRKLKESLLKAKEHLNKLTDKMNNEQHPHSKLYQDAHFKANAVKERIRAIQSKLNLENSFTVEHHHTEKDIHDAYSKGHRGFKIKRDDPKFDEKYSIAHSKLYNNDHNISTTHHKDKSITVHAK